MDRFAPQPIALPVESIEYFFTALHCIDEAEATMKKRAGSAPSSPALAPTPSNSPLSSFRLNSPSTGPAADPAPAPLAPASVGPAPPSAIMAVLRSPPVAPTPERMVACRAALEQYRMDTTNIGTSAETIEASKAALDATLSAISPTLLNRVTRMFEEFRGQKAATLREAKTGVRGFGVDSNPTKMHEIISRLFVGSYHPASDRAVLDQHRITHVCCCIGVDPRFPRHYKYITLPADDAQGYNMAQHFERTFNFIDGALSGGGAVFVHCGAGISRAPTVTAAYLIRKLGVDADTAISMIRTVRKVAWPNAGFTKQLKAFAEEQRALRAAAAADTYPTPLALSGSAEAELGAAGDDLDVTTPKRSTEL